MPRKQLYFIYAVIALFAMAFLALFSIEAWRDPTTGSYWHIATLVGSMLVAAGWIVTSENTMRNHARANAVGAISEYERSEAGKKNWEEIERCFPGVDDVLSLPGSSPEFSSEERKPYLAVTQELNRFGHVAMGVLNEVFDEGLIRNSMYGDFEALYRVGKPYIEYTRRFDGQDVWENFCTVCVRWGIQAVGELKPLDGSETGQSV